MKFNKLIPNRIPTITWLLGKIYQKKQISELLED